MSDEVQFSGLGFDLGVGFSFFRRQFLKDLQLEAAVASQQGQVKYEVHKLEQTQLVF